MIDTDTPREWVIDTVAPAPEVGMVGDSCEWSESGCPCCTCDERAEVRITWTRPRWSRSSKVWKMESRRESRCIAHSDIDEFPV